MVILPTIILFIQLAAGCRNKDPNVQCIDAAVGEGGSWPTVPFGGVLQWEFHFQNSTGGREISIEPSIGSGTKPVYVLGPFNGGGSGITTIKQYFACSYDSKVNVKYRLYSCGDLESPADKQPNAVDWSAVNFNEEEQPGTLVEGVPAAAEPLNPSTRLNEIVRAMNGGNGCEDEGMMNNFWSFTDIEINSDELPEVDANKRFTIALTGRISFREEWMAFGGIRVICIAKDRDEDKMPDTIDNCPNVYNPYQKDLDWDGKGDKCDYDMDGDWVPNKVDECPREPGSYYNKGCPEYGRDGKGDKGYSYGGGNGGGYDGNNKGDKGPGGRYGYNRDTGRGRGRGSRSYSDSDSGSYSSSDSSGGRGRRSRKGYGRDDKDEKRALEDLLRELQYEYRGSSKY